MVERSLRTRSKKRVRVRTPGGRTVTHFRRKKTGLAVCGLCHRPLSGVASAIPSEIRSLPKSSRIPNRPYAGVLCPNCLDSLVRYVTRMEVKHTAPELGDLRIQRNLQLEKYLPRGWWGKVTGGHVIRKRGKSGWPKGKPKKAAEAKQTEKPKKVAEAKQPDKPKRKAPSKTKPKAKTKR